MPSSKLTTSKSDELDEEMRDVPNYRGAVPKDWCNGKTPWPEEYIILNLENSGQPGSHWVAVCYKPDSKFIEYFDSFGLPIPDTILRYMKRSKKQPVGTTNEIQSMSSNAWGWYAANYLKQRALGVSPCDILYQFKANGEKSNDAILGKDLKKIDRSEMVRVHVFDRKGERLQSMDVPGSKSEIKKVLKRIPKGRHRVHFQLGGGKEESITVDYDPQQVAELQADPEISGNGFLDSLLGALPSLIPAVTPLIHEGVKWLSGKGMGDSDDEGQYGSAIDQKAFNRAFYGDVDYNPDWKKFGSKKGRERFGAKRGFRALPGGFKGCQRGDPHFLN